MSNDTKRPIDDLIYKLSKIRDELGSHHKGDGEVSFWIDDKKLALVSVEPTRAFGCGCWVGVELEFKEVEDGD